MKDLILTEGAPASFDAATQEEMTKSLKHFEHELSGIRSGRAHPSIVENIKVTCYGGETELPLKNLASIYLFLIKPLSLPLSPSLFSLLQLPIAFLHYKLIFILTSYLI